MFSYFILHHIFLLLPPTTLFCFLLHHILLFPPPPHSLLPPPPYSSTFSFTTFYFHLNHILLLPPTPPPTSLPSSTSFSHTFFSPPSPHFSPPSPPFLLSHLLQYILLQTVSIYYNENWKKFSAAARKWLMVFISTHQNGHKSTLPHDIIDMSFYSKICLYYSYYNKLHQLFQYQWHPIWKMTNHLHTLPTTSYTNSTSLPPQPMHI